MIVFGCKTSVCGRSPDSVEQSVDSHGQTIIKEPGNRTIVQVNNGVFIQHDETANFKLFGGNPRHRAANGNMVSTIVRPDGVRIEVEVDCYRPATAPGSLLPDGRPFVLFENRAIAVGVGFALGAFLVTLPLRTLWIPPGTIYRRCQLLPPKTISTPLSAGPVEPLDRSYSLDEVLASVAFASACGA